MKKIILFIVFPIILSFSSLFFAQVPGMVNYNEEDGLKSSYTYQLSQDHNGFIWVGSDNGLFRFDGKEFKQYDKKNGLKNIDVLACIALSNGEIFIIPFLSDYSYLKNDRVINSGNNRELKKIQFNSNPFLARNKDLLYLCDTDNPDTMYLYKNGTIKSIPLDFLRNRNTDKKYYLIGFDVNTNLLYTTYGRDKIEATNILTKKKVLCNISLEKGASAFKKDHFLITRIHRKIEIYTFENEYHLKKIQTYYADEDIHQIIVDKNNRLWICLQNGGALYFDQPLSDKKISAPVRILGDYFINYIIADMDNNIWFSTRNNGIFFITDRFFRNYLNLPIKNNSSFITAISDNGRDIILGYNESKSGIFRSQQINDIILEKKQKTEYKAIFAKNNMVIFGMSNAIFKYDLISKKKERLKTLGLKNIIPYTDHSVLFCTVDGLEVYDFVKNTYFKFFDNERVYSALPYSQDSLFVGGFKDLYKFNSKTKSKTLFLEGYYFKDIKKLQPGLYAGATNLNGIIIFNNKKILRKITEKEGLSTNQIKKLTIENETTFWAASNSGLSRIELKGNSVRVNNFTQIDGLPSNVVAGCVLRKDTIYVGTSKGLGILSISKLLSQQKTIDKKVIINSVVIGGKEYFNLNQKLIGQPPNNNVTFKVSFPDYTSQGKISYQYKIEGLNDGWQTSSSSTIILNAVPPGKYVLKIFGLGYNEKRSYTASHAAFEIKPQFWQTWWFKLLLILIVSAVLFSLITFYFQKKRNKKLETLYYEKKIAELELQAIKAQINPHFIYNCLNSIQFLLYKKDYQETENYLDIFSKMIRKTLHYSEKTFMPIQEEIEYLTLYLNMEQLRLKEEFKYTITVSEKVNKNWVIPSLLIQPFVENAIKHGISSIKDRTGMIEISFDYQTPSLCISIEDNGIGIGKKSESLSKANSFGVKLSQKRIETFRQLFETHIILEINDLSENQEKSGTQIKLYITPYEN